MPARQLPITGSAHKAAIIGDACVRTVLAAVDMTTQRRSATNLDCRQDAPLSEVYVAGIGQAPRLTMASEDISYLQLRSEHVRVTHSRDRRRRATGSAATAGPS
jgi:hypothetical protein